MKGGSPVVGSVMSQFEYIAVLVSVIAGLGIVHLLRGVARFFTDRVCCKPYWVHLLWTWNVFHFIVFFWWFVWRWSAVTEWQLLLYFFILLYATVLYIMCAVLYPAETREKTDFRTLYFDNHRVFFTLWVLAVVMDIIDTKMKVAIGLSGFGGMHIFVWSALISGSLVAVKTKNHLYHAFWGVAYFVIMMFFELANFSVLRAG
jgi:hypothetical protein